MLAKLRRGIGKHPGELPDLWELTLQELPDEWLSYYGNPSRHENAIHTALTLYALHRQGKDRSMNVARVGEGERQYDESFGSAVARLVGQDANNLDAVKRRFDAVATASDFTELSRHARGLIQLLKAADLPMNYPRFAMDLYNFQFADRADGIRLRWGEDFYRVIDRSASRKEAEQ